MTSLEFEEDGIRAKHVAGINGIGELERPALNPKLTKMMVKMLVHQSRPLGWRHWSQKTVWMLRAPCGAASKKTVDQYQQPFALCPQVALVADNKTLVGRHVAGHDSPHKSFDFANRPSTRPITLRGGNLSPTTISICSEQCASACAGFILPHCRWLSGRNCAMRPFISLTAAASNRFSMRKLFSS